MKLLKTFAIAILLTGFTATSMAQSPKFGHVNATFVLSKMPEYQDAMKQLSKLDSTYNLELEKLSVEINKKVDEYQRDTISPQLLKDVKAQEIQELQVRAQQFQQRIEQDINQQQQALIRPISQKVIKAINELAEEQGLLYVFDVSAGNPVYVSDESVDMVPLLMEKFNISYDPSELMPRNFR